MASTNKQVCGTVDVVGTVVVVVVVVVAVVVGGGVMGTVVVGVVNTEVNGNGVDEEMGVLRHDTRPGELTILTRPLVLNLGQHCEVEVTPVKL